MVKRTPFPLTDEELSRFWSKVDRSGGPDACWPWTARIGTNGYGVVTITRDNIVPKYQAHRIAYTIAHQQSIGDVLVCHSCDNPTCCNPAHLWIGTHKDNMLDRHRKDRTFRKHSREEIEARKNYKAQYDRFGEGHFKAKLTTDQVREIRARYVKGKIGYRRLADEYGVTPMAIKAIVTGRTWKKAS